MAPRYSGADGATQLMGARKFGKVKLSDSLLLSQAPGCKWSFPCCWAAGQSGRGRLSSDSGTVLAESEESLQEPVMSEATA